MSREKGPGRVVGLRGDGGQVKLDGENEEPMNSSLMRNCKGKKGSGHHVADRGQVGIRRFVYCVYCGILAVGSLDSRFNRFQSRSREPRLSVKPMCFPPGKSSLRYEYVNGLDDP